MNGVFRAIQLGGLSVVLSLHTDVDPSREEWSQFLEELGSALRDQRGNVDGIRNLAISDGGAPNAAQRREMMEHVGNKANKVAVITSSLENPIKRGVATALTWLNPAFRAGPPSKWQDLLGHVGLTGHVEELLRELDELQRELPKVDTLTELKKLVRA